MSSRFLFPVLALLAFLGGCARQQPPASSEALKPVDLRFPADDLGRPIELKQPAKRVVVIGPGAIETMFALDAQGQLVGRDDFANVPPAAKKVAIGGNFQGPNIEQCLALRPDLVIVQGETSNKSKFEDWQSKMGVPVAALTTTNFQSLARDFRKLGAWIGKSKQADEMAKGFEIPLPALKKSSRALIQTGDSPGWIAGRGTLVSDTARHAGFGNIADELGIDGYKEINVESLLVKQPDVLIVPSSQPKSQVLAALRANAALSGLECVRRGRVLVVNGDFLLRPGPRLLTGVQQLRAQNGDRGTAPKETSRSTS